MCMFLNIQCVRACVYNELIKKDTKYKTKRRINVTLIYIYIEREVSEEERQRGENIIKICA
jgi:hypothetical protein